MLEQPKLENFQLPPLPLFLSKNDLGKNED
jgi:hypothetical protein